MIHAIFIMQCLVIIFLFVLSLIIVFALYSESENSPKKADPQKEVAIFKDGVQHSWAAINISLYKMWNQLDILDFDNLQEKLQITINELTTNPVLMEEWNKKFTEYLKEREK